MGRIKKAAGPKHEATLSTALSDFVSTATKIPLTQLSSHLQSFPARWPFPRGDLYHWIPLLDHFDGIIEDCIGEYGLKRGPQIVPFGQRLLHKSAVLSTHAPADAAVSGFGPEGDRVLIENILDFSRILLENCGNRSLYSSSDRLGDLLNTTSPSLLLSTLRIAVRLAQRYHASRQRGANASQQLNNALLTSHYNINLENVQKLAEPFTKMASQTPPVLASTPAVGSGLKGKDEVASDSAGYGRPKAVATGNDMFAIVKEVSPPPQHLPSNGADNRPTNFEEWGDVLLAYYQPSAGSEDEKSSAVNGTLAPSSPTSPSTMRRFPGISRPSRLSISEDSNAFDVNATLKVDVPIVGGPTTVFIPYSTIASNPLENILEANLPNLPKEVHYEFLARLQVAKSLTKSLATRQQMLGIRILAITNLAYIYPESRFQEKVLQMDSDEPRRLQLVYQLADLVHPPGNSQASIPLGLKTIALGALEALSKHKSRHSDICTALSINVNHGVLLYILRKTVADLAIEDVEGESFEGDQWREALFALLDALPSSAARTAESLVGAGLFDVLIEILTLRTNKAERNHPRVIMFINTIIYTVRDAFQAFATAKGFDAVSNLVAWEVTSSMTRIKADDILADRFKNQVMDYEMPFFQQQTLRWLFKLLNHMMQHGNANFDRLLRNLIDSPPLLDGLRQVIANGKVFGSNVWSGAVNILSSFIHNEPTSYTVIHEAGLSKSLLEAITMTRLNEKTLPVSNGAHDPPESDPFTDASGGAEPQVLSQPEGSIVVIPDNSIALAQGILPATDAIVTIPQAFGAICLNTTGLALFLESGALRSFFEVFQSSDHVKALSSEIDLPRVLGNSFDELVRHHPRLKTHVMDAVTHMLKRLVDLCRSRAEKQFIGAKLWTKSESGELKVSGGTQSLSEAPIDDDGFRDSIGDIGEVHPMPQSSFEEESKSGEQPTTVAGYINVAIKFLAGFFENTGLCALFIEGGGVQSILDLATLPSLPYDFNNQIASQEIAKVMHMLVEQKPHLVLPPLISRTMKTLDILGPLMANNTPQAVFASFTSLNSETQDTQQLMLGRGTEEPINGTAVIKGLVNIHTLCNILHETFSPPIFTSRSNNTLFSQVNLTDLYIDLSKRLGRLHRACVWEEILLQRSIPEKLKEATRIKGYGTGSDEADGLFGFIRSEPHNLHHGEIAPQGSAIDLRTPIDQASLPTDDFSKEAADEETARFKNIQSLRYLLSQIPSSITPFFQGLGKALVPKRRLENYARQNAYMVAEALAEATLGQILYEMPRKWHSLQDRYAYWIVILNSISHLMIESPLERPIPQCLTLVLQAFKAKGGLNAVKDLLEIFFQEVKDISSAPEQLNVGQDGAGRLASAYGGIKIIFMFYTQITTSKYIVDSNQTQGMSSMDRDHEHPNNFHPDQFLVELRMSVLPVVRSVWDSEFVDRASNSILKCLIDILRTVLDGDHEDAAYKRSNEVQMSPKTQFKTYNISPDKLNTLKAKGIDVDLAKEALYRTMNNREAAEEYCKALTDIPRSRRIPIPSYDQEVEKSPTPEQTSERQDSEATVPDIDNASQSEILSPSSGSWSGQPSAFQEHQVEVEETENDPNVSIPPPPPPPAPEWPPGMDAENGDDIAMNIDIVPSDLLSVSDLLNAPFVTEAGSSASRENFAPATMRMVNAKERPDIVTVDDLEEERSLVRKNLIDRALDVLNVHGDLTFELSDLIITAATKAPEATTMRKEIGETLVNCLISFQDGEDLRPNGKKIAAYANLLALVIQEKEFYDATLDGLRRNLGQLLGFVKISPDQNGDESFPWVGQILLVAEKLLAEDVQPQQIRWTPPNSDDTPSDETIVTVGEPLIPQDEKLQLFENITELLPIIGKDESLALSVTRVLVILTRNRQISDLLGEKKNLQRLFVMVKQLAGVTSEKFQSAFMLILRHIAEDDETVRQIMRSEIIANFETRPSRPTDTTGYVRQMYHLVLRSPQIFVETTNEKLKLQSFDPNQRPQVLILKSEVKDSEAKQETGHEVAELNGATVTSNNAEVSRIQEKKAPVVEHPDGVIHYLLSQLLAYKDVDDKDPELTSKEVAKEESSVTVLDVEMANGTSASSPHALPRMDREVEKKPEKAEFKAEQHPIFVYRCFLLQCLHELLASYTHAKIEFINFSRKTDPKAMTPSKPRSGVLNYLTTALIPLGTIERGTSIAFQKKAATAAWAMSTIVSLCMRTSEKAFDKRRPASENEQDPDLLFVRKFVLEHILRVYKDAHTSIEALDMKYSRLLFLAELFCRLLSAAPHRSNPSTTPTENVSHSQKEMAKLMFERNFISVLTASIADIDLNFPESKRVIKYILRPLKVLTQTAVYLSENSSPLTIPGQVETDEISTASSVSEIEEDREETPDLFRHSTLGMLEPRGEEASSSESSDGDEEMYDDEYDDGIEYEEEMERDVDEVISDEEEEMEGAGHVEGLPGDVGMDVEVVIDGEDDDEPSEDEDPDDSDDMEEDENVEIMDEINGDDDNDSLAEGNEEEWQDQDDDEEEDHGEDGVEQDGDYHHNHEDIYDPDTTVRDMAREIQNAGITAPGIDGEQFRNLEMDIENDVYMDDVVRDEDDDDEEEGEEEMEDEDVIYEPDYDDDDAGVPDPPWGWDPDDEPAVQAPRGHHHSRRMNPWALFPSGAERGSTYRTHRTTGAPRGTDDGSNPLLQRPSAGGPITGYARTARSPFSDAGATMSDWVHMINPRHPSEGAVSFVNSIMTAVGQGPVISMMGGPHPAGTFHVHINNGPAAHLPREIQAILGLSRRPMPEAVRTTRDNPLDKQLLPPVATVTRWQEEARLLFGNTYTEKIQRVVNSLLKILVPPALEEERARKKREAEDAEALRKRREEEVKAKDEERIAKEKAEKEAQEQQERNEREAADRAATVEHEATVNAETDQMLEVDRVTQGGEDMEGIVPTQAEESTTSEPLTVQEESTEAGPSEQVERVRATFRGREIDITGLGIDLDYLDALPDELREEVLMQQLAEQRSQAAAAGEEPTDISREFLEALPREIREELLQQEAQDRRRREREETRRQAAANGGSQGARAEEMDPASFLASLDPHLREAVLLEQDDDMLAQLPQAIAAEARALGGDRIMHRWGEVPRPSRPVDRNGRDARGSEQVAKKSPRRHFVQMLDKSGVATLLRLLFVSQQGTSRRELHDILHNVSQNRQNRAEVVNLLLSILQDGSADISAVERSFIHLSLRAKQPSSQKTSQTSKRTLAGQMGTPLSSEMAPLMVIQQCLSALVYLTGMNPHIRFFFLTEHETSSGLKGKLSRKGKGKETRASKFALNALLSLLNRKLIMESSSCMEQLSTLLQSITHPLSVLLRRDRDHLLELGGEAETVADTAVETADAPAIAAETTEENDPPADDEDPSEDVQMTESNVLVPDLQPASPGTMDSVNANPALGGEQSAAMNVADGGDAEKSDEQHPTKKPRQLTPPYVPEHNLQLVVNILAARECSAKTFRDTVSTINNLSAIPDAKGIFGKELIRQAQDLGESISSDLDDLVSQIRTAEPNTDIHSIALAKFSPSSSDQAKLLRVLTALDYLFDPKRARGKGDLATDGNTQDGELKDDLLTALYENSTFGPLWNKLSECLSTIRQRDNMINVATILLPLIEALMVVCKNTTLKDASTMRVLKEFAVTSPPPESRMENLFFRFTEEHRKVLNDLVRQSPRLMSGTFSLLVKNPKVLEFDNKRNYFTRRLHSRGTEARNLQPPLQLSLRRDSVFGDSFKRLYYKSAEEMKYGKLSIRFHGEEGVDAGGVTREWFQVMSRQMFNADYALFTPVASDRTTFHPNKDSQVNEEHLMYFKFIGRVIGKALYEGRALDCHFSRAMYKRILSKPVSLKDMETLNLNYYKSLEWMLENDISDIITETFSIETETFGETQIVDLIENGRNVAVTEENKQEYVQLIVEYRLTGSVKFQLEEFLRGFHDIVPAELISIFNEQELELLISGLPDIDVDDWKNNTEYHNYSASSAQIQWFWRAVRSFDKEERAKLLQFVTGTSKVPLNGFKELEGMNGFSRFNIHRDYGNKDRLPSSHTCFNQIDLPEYESYEALRKQVYTAITAGSEYFGFA